MSRINEEHWSSRLSRKIPCHRDHQLALFDKTKQSSGKRRLLTPDLRVPSRMTHEEMESSLIRVNKPTASSLSRMNFRSIRKEQNKSTQTRVLQDLISTNKKHIFTNSGGRFLGNKKLSHVEVKDLVGRLYCVREHSAQRMENRTCYRPSFPLRPVSAFEARRNCLSLEAQLDHYKNSWFAGKI